jgi:outer membrane lipoprotein-sorting protein
MRADRLGRRATLAAWYAVLALWALPIGALPASTPTLAEVLNAHCRAREATKSLRARFVQTKVFAALDERDTSSGVLCYRRPDALRWQYLEPDTSWTVVRGQSGWSVFPGIRQVQKFTLRGARAEALLSVIGFGSCGRDLRESFRIALRPGGDGAHVLEMVPEDPRFAASFARVDLTLDAKDFLPRKVVMREVSGDTTSFEFLGLERDARLADGLFEYEIPKGYTVVE